MEVPSDEEDEEDPADKVADLGAAPSEHPVLGARLTNRYEPNRCEPIGCCPGVLGELHVDLIDKGLRFPESHSTQFPKDLFFRTPNLASLEVLSSAETNPMPDGGHARHESS